jgi:hypothetical protein
MASMLRLPTSLFKGWQGRATTLRYEVKWFVTRRLLDARSVGHLDWLGVAAEGCAMSVATLALPVRAERLWAALLAATLMNLPSGSAYAFSVLLRDAADLWLFLLVIEDRNPDAATIRVEDGVLVDS